MTIEVGKTYVFKSTSQSEPYRSMTGETVRVIRPLIASEADLEESGPMFRVQQVSDNGRYFDAYQDELSEPTKRIVITTDAGWLPDILNEVSRLVGEGFTSGHFDSNNYWNVED